MEPNSDLHLRILNLRQINKSMFNEIVHSDIVAQNRDLIKQLNSKEQKQLSLFAWAQITGSNLLGTFPLCDSASPVNNISDNTYKRVCMLLRVTI